MEQPWKKKKMDWLRLSVVLLLCFAILSSPVGCTRRFYRKQVDREVDVALHEKANHPLWKIGSFPVYPDPRSRFADPTDPDHPPMPPDDPGAYHSAPNPQKPYKKSGIGYVEGTGYLQLLAYWDQLNRKQREAEQALKREKEKQQAKPEASEPGNKGKQKEGPQEKGKQEKQEAKGADKNEQEPQPEGARSSGQQARAASLADEYQRRLQRQLAESYGIATPEEEVLRELSAPVTTSKALPLPAKDDTARAKLEQGFQGPPDPLDAVMTCGGTEPYLINLEQAVELGLINSREYQQRREELYLAALPVTLERFSFAAQFQAFGTLFRERFGRETPEGFTNRWRFNNALGFSKLFSTGALLLAAIANETVYNLGRSGRTLSVSTISLDIIQPLLRGAGKAVTLEPLTQAERNLLYAVRDFAKFRQEFYVFVAAGQPTFIPGVQAGVQAITPGTVNRPGVFIPAAAPLAAPLGFNPAGAIIRPGDAGRLFPLGLGGGVPQGYLSTLLRKYLLLNQYENIQALQGFLDRFRVYQDGGIVNAVQVGQVEQRLLNSIDNVLSGQASFRSDLDQFKLQLGLPLTLNMDLDEAPLLPVLEQIRRYDSVYRDYQVAVAEAQKLGDPGQAPELEETLVRILTESDLVRGTDFPQRFRRNYRNWQERKSIKEARIWLAEYGVLYALARLARSSAPFRKGTDGPGEDGGPKLPRDPSAKEQPRNEESRQEQYTEVRKDFTALILAIQRLMDARGDKRRLPTYTLPEDPDKLTEYLDETALSRAALPGALRIADEKGGMRLEGVEGPLDTFSVAQYWQDLSKASPEQKLTQLDFELALGEFRRSLLEYQDEKEGWKSRKSELEREDSRRRQFNRIIQRFRSLLEFSRKERLDRIIRQWPALDPLCLAGVDLLRADDDRALATIYRAALANRLDLMNRRAQLVDSWRKIRVAANALLGTFNVQYHMDALTPPNGAMPLAFAGSRTRHQLILDYELPLVRLAERNNYRSALIAYQQQRRALMVAEDLILFAVRLELRQLRVIANTYHRVRKRAVELAYQQVDQALEAFDEPQRPQGPALPQGFPGPPGGTGGGSRDPAALTTQLLTTQNALLGAQNDLYNTWIAYITTRMSLYRDLGIMPLDPRGVWIDDLATCEPQPVSSPGRPEPQPPQATKPTGRPARGGRGAPGILCRPPATTPTPPGEQLPGPRRLPGKNKGPEELPRPRKLPAR